MSTSATARSPKHGSWLNLIEGFFSRFARSVLRHIRVRSEQEKERMVLGIKDVNRYRIITHGPTNLPRLPDMIRSKENAELVSPKSGTCGKSHQQRKRTGKLRCAEDQGSVQMHDPQRDREVWSERHPTPICIRVQPR